MIFQPSGIIVFSLWIQTNSLLSLRELDQGAYLSVLMTCKVPSLFGVAQVFYVKNMPMDSVNGPIFSLFSIFYIAPVVFQEINQIIALACVMHHEIICLVAA